MNVWKKGGGGKNECVMLVGGVGGNGNEWWYGEK